MNITIVGAGRVGVHLAKYFADEHQDVYLIDNDSSNLAILEADFNLRTFLGEPIDFTLLREANSDKADIFVAVTGNTATNLVTCAMAKSMGAKKTIARVDKFEFLESANFEAIRKMGVDHIVYPDYLAALSVASALEHPWCYGWNEFNDGDIVMVAVSIDEDSPISGICLRDMYKETRKMHISALKRGNKTVIPHGEDYIEPKDILYITTVTEELDKVKQITEKTDNRIKNVIIMGGSAVAGLVTDLSAKRFSFVIVEKSLERCRKLTELCPEAEIIYGDGTEQDVLEEAGIHACDAFVALSDSSETNILGCLAAQDLGIKRTIAEIEKEQYIPKGESFNIGAIINKPIITANAIFQLILDSDLLSSKCFAMKDAEVAKMEIRADSYLTKYPVKDLSLPKELNFAGLIRNGKGEIVTGNTLFKKGDKVIVFCLNGSLNKVEKLFKK